MLGSDKSRGYCLEMICADFLAGAQMDGSDPDILLNSIPLLQVPARSATRCLSLRGQPEGLMNKVSCKSLRLKLDLDIYCELHRQVLARDRWRCQICGAMQHLQVHHLEFRSQSGGDEEENLISPCAECHCCYPVFAMS